MRVSLFVTCLVDTLYPQTGRATVELLERLGHEVEFPDEQTCCGQMHANAGYRPEARRLQSRFAAVFADAEQIVTPSGSCAAMVREHCPSVASRVYELSQFLTEVLGVTDVGAYYPHRVTYHPACHAHRALGIGDAPLRLLRAVAALDLVELPDAASCCGFGGTFAVKNAETSAAILADKVRSVLDTGAEVCTALDNSCLLQIGGALSRLRAGVRTAHLAEILASEAA